MMYPECNHGITLRVWGNKQVIAVLKERLSLDVEVEGEAKSGTHCAVYCFSRKKEANLENEVGRLMDMIGTSAGIPFFPNDMDVWIVVAIEEFVLFNLEKRTLKRLSVMNISISVENHD